MANIAFDTLAFRYMPSMSLTQTLITLALITIAIRWLRPSEHDLSHIPAVGGPTFPILSYYGAVKYLFNARGTIQEGYKKYKGGAFKYPGLFRWMVVVTGRELIEDLRKARDDELSFSEASNESLQIEYTLGPAVHHNPYHSQVVRTQLTRHLGEVLTDIRDEITDAFNEMIPPTDDWVNVPAIDAVRQVICRTSNRIYVGAPTCRDQEFVDLNLQSAINVVKGGLVISMIPKLIRPFLAPWFTNVSKSIETGMRLLGPVIEERYKMMDEHGRDWDGKPNDLLSWLIDGAPDGGRSDHDLIRRILTINFASIHASSMAFTHALYQLAANPEYIASLREEVERVVQQEGWTKTALDKMKRVDSFFRESQRLYPVGIVSMTRKTLKDFIFSDGTRIPAGTFVSPSTIATQYDDAYFEHPKVFNPWRFSELESADDEGRKYGMVDLSAEHLPFGYGRHACPGRFFAAVELKAMMAHLVLNYDVKMENEGVVPKPVEFSNILAPNPKAVVMFRRRRL